MALGIPPLGPMVQLMVLPRFTSYIGIGKQVAPGNDTSYRTVAFNVERFTGGRFLFWRGPLVGGAGADPFNAYFEESQDQVLWSLAGVTPSQPVTTVATWGTFAVLFTKKWFRVRIELNTTDPDNVVAITVWMAGELESRVATTQMGGLSAATAKREPRA